MRAIFIDTETTGLPPRDRTITPDKVKGAWPDLVSLSWLISLDEKIITAQSHIIKPNGWTIGDGAIQKHGISNELAAAEGIPLKTVFATFLDDLKTADIMIAYNVEFDKNVLLNALLYHLEMTLDDTLHIWPKHEFCPMELSRSICKLPLANPRPPFLYKSPTLKELYEHTFKYSPPQSFLHTSLGDTMILHTVFFKHWTLLFASNYVPWR